LILKNLAVVVIDVQIPFYSENEKVKMAFPKFKENTTALLKHARAKGFLPFWGMKFPSLFYQF